MNVYIKQAKNEKPRGHFLQHLEIIAYETSWKVLRCGNVK